MATPIPSVDASALVTPSAVYSSILVGTAEGESSATLLSTGFEGLKTTLNFIERAASAFPPLKSVVGGLLGVIDVIEVRTRNILRDTLWHLDQFPDDNSKSTRSRQSRAKARGGLLYSTKLLRSLSLDFVCSSD